MISKQMKKLLFKTNKPVMEKYKVGIIDESEPSWLKPQLKLKDFQIGLARLGLWPFSFCSLKLLINWFRNL